MLVNARIIVALLSYKPAFMALKEELIAKVAGISVLPAFGHC